MSKLPFMQFYPRDWIDDTRMLPAVSRAIWIDLICEMWKAPERGVLKTTIGDVARLCGVSHADVTTAIADFQRLGTCDISDNSCELKLTSRRMVREETERHKNRDRQRLSRRRHGDVTPDVTDASRQCQQDIAEGILHIEEREREAATSRKKYNAEIPIGLKTPEFEKAWKDWTEYKQDSRRGQNWNHAGQRRDLAFLERMEPTHACEVIDYTIRGGLDRLTEPIGAHVGSNQKGAKFVTRGMVEAWCAKKNCKVMINRAWGVLMSGRYYGKHIGNQDDFLAAMTAIHAEWLKEP